VRPIPLEMLLIVLFSVFVIIMAVRVMVLLLIAVVHGLITYSVRNVASRANFCHINYNGNAAQIYAPERRGARPRFWVININGSQDIKVKPTKEDYFYAFTI